MALLGVGSAVYMLALTLGQALIALGTRSVRPRGWSV
jgi:hypothetical protein